MSQLDHGVSLVQQAIEQDSTQNYREACHLYRAAIIEFQRLIRSPASSHQLRDLISETCVQYEQRLRVIEGHLLKDLDLTAFLKDINSKSRYERCSRPSQPNMEYSLICPSQKPMDSSGLCKEDFSQMEEIMGDLSLRTSTQSLNNCSPAHFQKGSCHKKTSKKKHKEKLSKVNVQHNSQQSIHQMYGSYRNLHQISTSQCSLRQREGEGTSDHSLNPKCKQLDASIHSLNPQSRHLATSAHSLNPQCGKLETNADLLNPQCGHLATSAHSLNLQYGQLDSSKHSLKTQFEQLDSSVHSLYPQCVIQKYPSTISEISSIADTTPPMVSMYQEFNMSLQSLGEQQGKQGKIWSIDLEEDSRSTSGSITEEHDDSVELELSQMNFNCPDNKYDDTASDSGISDPSPDAITRDSKSPESLTDRKSPLSDISETEHAKFDYDVIPNVVIISNESQKQDTKKSENVSHRYNRQVSRFQNPNKDILISQMSRETIAILDQDTVDDVMPTLRASHHNNTGTTKNKEAPHHNHTRAYKNKEPTHHDYKRTYKNKEPPPGDDTRNDKETDETNTSCYMLAAVIDFCWCL